MLVRVGGEAEIIELVPVWGGVLGAGLLGDGL
jgi:hypothetical protein